MYDRRQISLQRITPLPQMIRGTSHERSALSSRFQLSFFFAYFYRCDGSRGYPQ